MVAAQLALAVGVQFRGLAPAAARTQPTIGKLIDDAMLAIEGNNALLKWVLPKLISGEIRLREAEEAMA